jgi:uncharacterized protein
LKGLLCLLVLLLLPVAVQAAPPSNESVDALFAKVDMQRAHEAMLDMMDRALLQAPGLPLQDSSTTENDRRLFAAIVGKLGQLMREEMSWEIMRPVYVRMYKDTLTQDEMDGLVAYVSSPEGKAVYERIISQMEKYDGPASETIKDTELSAFLDTSTGKVLKAKEPAMRQILFEDMQPHMARAKARMIAFIEVERAFAR